ncbi:hypothetical protein N0V93_006021 [Gnomoniopsis smithogilvyi]|uniref:Serine aminopeptidase S33 domain-containing protein n=1 Tax=Gnomoniopsis smithogilvyi TaxID=1191159 RepID=A0A9W9CU45_9PEZI|nr:hypothetical protein N0V93_006021 [Gnomoniopsis smithogilvyi]
MPFLQAGDKQIHFTDYAPTNTGAGQETPTIICHHGLGSSQNFYYPIVPALVEAGFRVIVFDTSGAARSPYTQMEQSIASLASDVLSILDAFSIPKAIIMGHSMGGIVASHLASDSASKGRIQAAILIGPVYPNEAVSQAFEKRIDIVGKQGMSAMAETIPFSAPGQGASPLVRAFIRELLLGQSSPGYLSHCRVICNAKRPSYEDIEAPLLLIAGEEDKSAALSLCVKMFDEAGSRDKSMEVLKGVGHWHCLEAPDMVAKKILGFLKEKRFE